MTLVWILLGAVLLAAALLWLLYLVTFCRWPERRLKPGEFDLPPGKIYEPHYDAMRAWQKELWSIPRREVYIKSFDGLKLHGRYYEYAPGAPVELMFHGYRGNMDRDLCGGVQRCFKLKHSALIVDQRATRESEGRTITFGVRESRDCLSWVAFLMEELGPEVKIILTGISMGGATVLMAAGRGLPPNVVGILADCGYTSPREIIEKVIRDMKLPPKPVYAMLRLSARLFGRFDPDELSAEAAMRRCTVPVLFVHGEADAFVPCSMSRANHEACAAPKRLFTVPGAGHGLSYVIDPEGYLSALADMAPLWGLE